MDKFKEMCEEMGGELSVEKGWLVTKDAMVCEFMDDDDFKAFSHWMDRQQKFPGGKEFKAKFDYMEGVDFMKSEFTVEDSEKNLLVEHEKSIGDTEGMGEFIKIQIPAKHEKHADDIIERIDFRDVYTDTAVEKLLEHPDIKPYIKDHADVEVGFNSDWDYHYTKGIVNFPFHKGAHLRSIMEDSEKATELMEQGMGRVVFSDPEDSEILQKFGLKLRHEGGYSPIGKMKKQNEIEEGEVCIPIKDEPGTCFVPNPLHEMPSDDFYDWLRDQDRFELLRDEAGDFSHFKEDCVKTIEEYRSNPLKFVEDYPMLEDIVKEKLKEKR